MVKLLPVGALALSLVLGACASQDTTDVSGVDTADTHTQTVAAPYAKPGAAVTFTYDTPDDTAVSASGHLSVSVNETYESGILSVDVSGSEGLQISANSVAKQFNVEGRDTHALDVYYSADADGKYYVNLSAKGPDGRTRVHAIGVVIGDMTKAAPKATPKTATDSEGNTVIIMDAEETIQ